MVLRCRLREPHIACIAGELPALERAHDGVTDEREVLMPAHNHSRNLG